MKKKKRKIGFYNISLSTEEDFFASNELKQIVNFITSQDKVKRKMNLSPDKFCFLENGDLNEDGTEHALIFKSAAHSYRAPLIDRETISERDNPKTLREGEIMKTHFLIKYIDDEPIIIGEKVRDGVSISKLIQYFNTFKNFFQEVKHTTLNYRFRHDIIVKDNIHEELNKLNRVLSASVYVDKQLLGSEALNFSERIDSAKENIVIDIKASRKQSIKDIALDLLAKLNGGHRELHKIKIRGKNEAENDIMIDTDFFEKREFVEAYINEDTGEADSDYFIGQLKEIGNTL